VKDRTIGPFDRPIYINVTAEAETVFVIALKGQQDSARLRKAFVAARFLGLVRLTTRARQSVATAA
jgi:hypothetical protein